MNKYDEAILLFSDFIKYCEKTKQDHDLQADKLALEALKQASERENPQPLTLEQLKERVGKPVYILTGELSIDEQIIGEWQIVKSVDLLKKEFWHKENIRPFKFKDYEITWLVYDHEPKEV